MFGKLNHHDERHCHHSNFRVWSFEKSNDFSNSVWIFLLCFFVSLFVSLFFFSRPVQPAAGVHMVRRKMQTSETQRYFYFID